MLDAAALPRRSSTPAHLAEPADRWVRPEIEGIPAAIWIRRYYQWRLDAALSGRATRPAQAIAAPVVQRPSLEDLGDEDFDVAGYLAMLREESAAQGVPKGLKLTDRRIVRPRPATRAAGLPAAAPATRPAKLAELLRHDDAEFIRQAYLAVLKRPADRSGMANYLSQLTSRRADKIAILRSLRNSPEGRKRGTRIPGLGFWGLYYGARRRVAQHGRQVLARLRFAALPPAGPS